MNRKLFVNRRSVLCAALLLATIAFAEPPADSPALKASQAQADTYVAAFNKGDEKALAAMYAEDAQYTSDDGENLSGRAAVQEGLKRFFAKNKGAKLSVKIDSARFLTPDVLIEKGISTIGDESTRYVCEYVKKDGAWQISELTEITLPPLDAASDALEDIGWMVGSWKDNSPNVDVATSVDWTKNHHFLRRSLSISRGEGDTTEATEVIGFDPTAGNLRSWVFDSEGGFGEGTWKREGNKWIISFTATAPDGTVSSAQHVISYVDDKKFTWESINRVSDGETLPNLEKVEVVRTTPAPAPGQ